MTDSLTLQINIPSTGIKKHIELTTQQTWTVGRSSKNSIVLTETSVSRHHAKLEILNNRHCYFIDLNSSNGSQVNNKPVVDLLLLKHGDVITIGTTELRFSFPFATHSGSTLPHRPKQVLMMQESAKQGLIWQEILCSQGFDVCWVSPFADLQQRINLDAAANILPDLFLIDLAAYPGDAFAFRAWCHEKYPDLPLFLTHSKEAGVVEKHAGIATSHSNLLLSVPSTNFSQAIDTVSDQLQNLFHRVRGVALKKQELKVALRSLEDILDQTSVSKSLDIPNTPEADIEEFTVLHGKKVKVPQT